MLDCTPVSSERTISDNILLILYSITFIIVYAGLFYFEQTLVEEQHIGHITSSIDFEVIIEI